jgi:hypothetical protein
MRTEGFRKRIVMLALAMGVSAAFQPVLAQSFPTLLPVSESGGIQPVSLGSEPQNSQSLSTIRVTPLEPAKQDRVISAERPSRKSWLALSIVLHGAAAFDAYSTRDAISHGAVEEDPLMRPFAGSPAMYAANQAGPLILDLVARRMQRSNNSFLRRMWWLPQSAAAVDFVFCGVHNLHVANQP